MTMYVAYYRRRGSCRQREDRPELEYSVGGFQSGATDGGIGELVVTADLVPEAGAVLRELVVWVPRKYMINIFMHRK